MEAQRAPYAGLGGDTETFLVFAAGSLGFRYGPFRADSIGPIVEEAAGLGMPVMISFQVGTEPDWEMLTDFYGGPEGLQANREKMAQPDLADEEGE